MKECIAVIKGNKANKFLLNYLATLHVSRAKFKISYFHKYRLGNGDADGNIKMRGVISASTLINF